MPLYIPVKEAQPGMRLTEPFWFMGRTMIAAGKVLTPSDVNKLRERFSGRYIRINDPILDNSIEFENDSHERNVARHVQDKITKCLSNVEQQLSCRTSSDAGVFNQARSVVEQMTTYLADNPVTAALLDTYFEGDGYLSKHAGNVFYLSLVMAMAAHSYVAKSRTRSSISSAVARDMMPLGLGAMFIDLGMQPFRDQIEKPTPLTNEIRDAIRQHPITGADMLPDGFPGSAKMVVRTHHENCAGLGYPDGIGLDKLHVFSRIVRIADAFDSATSTHVFKNGKSAVFALWAMQTGPYKRFYDSELMKTFVTLVQPFPIGAKLRLTDGRQAVVVKYNRTNPFEPTVVIALSADGRRLRDSQLQGPLILNRQSGLRIASYNEEDLSFLYETPGTPLHERPLFNDNDQHQPTSLFHMMFP